jgi:hypothetical protein
MVTINEFARRHCFEVQRDIDGTTIIPGRKGKSHLFEYDDELLGVMVMPDTGTAHWWNAARAAFLGVGMEIRQIVTMRARRRLIQKTRNRFGYAQSPAFAFKLAGQ